MGDHVNFVVTQPKFSLRHYISVADNDAEKKIIFRSSFRTFLREASRKKNSNISDCLLIFFKEGLKRVLEVFVT